MAEVAHKQKRAPFFTGATREARKQQRENWQNDPQEGFQLPGLSMIIIRNTPNLDLTEVSLPSNDDMTAEFVVQTDIIPAEENVVRQLQEEKRSLR